MARLSPENRALNGSLLCEAPPGGKWHSLPTARDGMQACGCLQRRSWRPSTWVNPRLDGEAHPGRAAGAPQETLALGPEVADRRAEGVGAAARQEAALPE